MLDTESIIDFLGIQLTDENYLEKKDRYYIITYLIHICFALVQNSTKTLSV